MGRSTVAVAVPHKIEGIAYDDMSYNRASGWELAITGQEGHGLPIIPNTNGPNGSHDPSYVDGVDLGSGWQYVSSCVDYVRHGDTLYCDEIINKDKGYTIFVVNESPYANGGEHSMSIFADTRGPLEQFVMDMNIVDAVILDTAAIQQTL